MALNEEEIKSNECVLSAECNVIVEQDETILVVPSRKVWLQNVLYTFTNHLVPALAAFLANSLSKSLAPLQRIPLNLPSGVVRKRFRRVSRSRLALADGLDESRIEEGSDSEKMNESPERCVNCTVMHEPEGEIFADVIFVHGLHGGLDRTWRQGTWRVKNPKLKNLSPIRRHSTDDMYVPVPENFSSKNVGDEGRLKRTLTKIYTTIPVKVARTKDANANDNVDEVDETEQVEEEIEFEDQETNVDNFSRCWPQDWLPQDCPGVRILGINYTTDVLWRPLWQKRKPRTSLPQRSNEMMEDLLRLGVGCRPIVWVGHSKGGLYIKQIILNGWHAKDNQTVQNLYHQTKAIMFYSVPHKGSPIADMTFPFFRRSIEVMEIRTNCDFVLNLHRSFLEIFNTEEQDKKPEIFSFIDTENTPVGFTSLKFIAYESADPDIGIKCDVPLDHREICKPAGRDCFLYLELVKMINKSIFQKKA
uniref:Protein SERAC1 n=2 Tax=Dendroctonus ponderosae TaxID=77166 RepID=A0AAR5PQJ8_DENPD